MNRNRRHLNAAVSLKLSDFKYFGFVSNRCLEKVAEKLVFYNRGKIIFSIKG